MFKPQNQSAKQIALAATTMSLFAALASAVPGGSSIEVLFKSNDLAVPPPGFPAGGVVWNATGPFSSPSVNDLGQVAFVGRIFDNDVLNPPTIVAGGTGVMGNDRVYYLGAPGSYNLIAQGGSPSSLPGPAGFTFNSTTGSNGLNTSTPSIAPTGPYLVSGSINFSGAAAVNDSAAFISDPSAGSFMVQEGSHAGDEAGDVYYSSSMSISLVRVNNAGEFVFHSNLLGADSALPSTGFTGTNMGIFVSGPNGTRTFARRGDLAPSFPGLPAGTQLNTQDSYGFGMNGAGRVAYGCRLSNDANPTSLTTSTDRCIISDASGVLEVVLREGDEVPGMPGVIWAPAPTSSPFNPTVGVINNAGDIHFSSTLSGAGITLNVNDYGVFVRRLNGSVVRVIQRGDFIQGASDFPFKFVNNTNWAINNVDFFAGAGVLLGAPTTSDEAVFAGQVGGPISLIIREGDAIPGLTGVFCGAMQSSANVGLNDANQVIFWLGLTGAGTTTTDNAAMFTWSPSTGLQLVMRKGDATVTGTAMSSIGWCGACRNGEGGSPSFSNTGWVGFTITYSGGAAIARVNVNPAVVCSGDLDSNAMVDGADLAMMLSNWGATGAGDINNDGIVAGDDLTVLLGMWGACN